MSQVTAPELVDPAEAELLRKALAGDADAFDRLTTPYRRRLHVHCYRMLGSPFDADDALQETLLAAWRRLGTFEGRSAVGTWLISIATRVCLRMIAKRPPRLTSGDYREPLLATAELGEPVEGRVWLEPIPDSEFSNERAGGDDPVAAFLRREHIRLAFIALLQHLPGTQRAVLLLREVLGYSAVETAGILETSIASINSALQRARKTLREKAHPGVPPASMAEPTEQDAHRLLQAFVSAWERSDVSTMVSLLADDARFTMPPLPAWFSGREFVAKFFAERVFATPWLLQPIRGNGQPGFACYQKQPGDDRFRPGGVGLLSCDGGRISAIDSFLDPAVCRRFGMIEALP